LRHGETSLPEHHSGHSPNDNIKLNGQQTGWHITLHATEEHSSSFLYKRTQTPLVRNTYCTKRFERYTSLYAQNPMRCPALKLNHCLEALTFGMMVAIGEAASADPYNPVYIEQMKQTPPMSSHIQPVNITEQKPPEKIWGNPNALLSVDATGATCSIGGTRSTTENNSIPPCLKLP